MDYYYVQPSYFGRFRCIGGDCPETCCRGWEIDWKLDEVSHMKSYPFSDELKFNIEKSFFLSEDKTHYYIKMDCNGKCPLHCTETGLCNIQKEAGEQFLGVVCRQYPRLYIEHKNQIIRWCASSCPAVFDLLINDESAVETVKTSAVDNEGLDRSTFVIDDDKTIEADPIKQVRMELFDFYLDMLLDKSRDLETSIILTAIAVKHFTAAEQMGQYSNIPKMAQELKKQLNSPAAANSLNDLKPNYQLKFKLVNNMLVKFFGNSSQIINISALHDGDNLNVENYLNGIDNFNRAFDNKPYILRNIIINNFYDLNMPIGKFKRPLFENYAYFVLVAASIKTVAASIGFSSNDIVNDFKICVSEMNRRFSHTVRLADMIIEDMLQNGIRTPAHLALIIK